MSTKPPWVYFVDDASEVWQLAERLYEAPGDPEETVMFGDRVIKVDQLLEVYRWMFDK